jgi:hypothetical protein
MDTSPSKPHPRPAAGRRLHWPDDPNGPTLAPALFNLRVRSLARANIIVILSLAAATLLSRAPHLQANKLLVLPALGCLLGLAETVRCMRRRWSFYHGGVILCIYMDLMAITLVLFFLLYPYFVWFSQTY